MSVEFGEKMSEHIANAATSVDAFADLEWSGKVNRALGQGRSFALLMSMLESNVLHRDKVVSNDDLASESPLDIRCHYRTPPLCASQKDWVLSDLGRQTFDVNQTDGLLFQALHPQPLAIFNDAKRVAPEVFQNCNYGTQQRYKAEREYDVQEEPAKLFDVLETLQNTPLI